MERSLLLKLLMVNVVAAGVLYARFAQTEAGVTFQLKAQAWLSRLLPSSHPNCGLIKWDDYVVFSNHVVLPEGIKPAAIHIVHGKIHRITDGLEEGGVRQLNYKDAVIMPGVIDVHAHLNEPGREDWEGITTGTKAAAMGGITTVIDMPLNSNPTTTTTARLLEKQKLARAKAYVNMGYWAGLVPGNAADHKELAALVAAGAAGFKAFMCPSGINDFEHVTAADLEAALPYFKQAGVPLMLHAEVVTDAPEPQGASTAYATYMHTRPPRFEQDAIKLIIQLLDSSTTPAAPGFRIHIAHLADAYSLPLIQDAMRRGLPISVETCAHYLTFHDTQIKDGQTWFKCAPPLRDQANQDALTQAVVAGTISIVSSDHSPAPPSMKQMDTGDFIKAWGGISGLQYLLPATWTAVKARGGSVEHVASLLSTEPAVLTGLAHRKGKLAVGYDADLVIWEPETAADTGVEANQHQHKVSPYTDVALTGKVVTTIVRGHFVNLFGVLSKTSCGAPVTD